MSMKETARAALLRFDPALNRLDDEGKELRDGLSAAVLVGDTLWLACDETTRLERLTRAGGDTYQGHEQFPLARFLDLHAKEKEEADVEGLDISDGYLWLVGSHSLKRTKPKAGKTPDKNRERLAAVTADGNRFLLARIPLVADGGTHRLEKEASTGDQRRVAAQLHGDELGSDLTAALEKDEHLGAFFGIPGKDNGFDIEGLAVSGGRVLIGLRGPVLRGWAMVLEVELGGDDDDTSVLRLKGIGPGGRPYRKHFLELGGLGVRDLCADGADLLILAGPTMDLDGPVALFRWENGARPEEQSVVFAGDKLTRVLDIPFGAGSDHAEGITLLPAEGGARRELLVLYDAPSAARKRGREGEAVLRADIFTMPE
ncbi:MAG TPA: DUF3616 domain-containing protein [Pyrinomonadaceae bacterium]|nr:DUF3616 domain-containing protein [Pyrinomonadaceae bacterium]